MWIFSNFLTFLNFDTNELFKISLPKGRLGKTLEITNEIYSEGLFEEAKIKNGIFDVKYRYKTKDKGQNWQGNFGKQQQCFGRNLNECIFQNKAF